MYSPSAQEYQQAEFKQRFKNKKTNEQLIEENAELLTELYAIRNKIDKIINKYE